MGCSQRSCVHMCCKVAPWAAAYIFAAGSSACWGHGLHVAASLCRTPSSSAMSSDAAAGLWQQQFKGRAPVRQSAHSSGPYVQFLCCCGSVHDALLTAGCSMRRLTCRPFAVQSAASHWSETVNIRNKQYKEKMQQLQQEMVGVASHVRPTAWHQSAMCVCCCCAQHASCV